MRKLVIAALALATVMTTAAPSYAGSDDPAYFLGGVIGGLVLGDVLQNNRHRHRNVDVYEEEPSYVRECVTKYRRYYDAYGNLVRRPVRKCYWVREY